MIADLITHSRSTSVVIIRPVQATDGGDASAGSTVPFENALAPDVDQADKQDDHKEHHLAIEDPLQSGVVSKHVGKNDGPRYQEDGFDVEQQEDHRHEVELHRLAFARCAHRLDAAFVG